MAQGTKPTEAEVEDIHEQDAEARAKAARERWSRRNSLKDKNDG